MIKQRKDKGIVMIERYLHINDVAKTADKLTSALLNQEQYFLDNYTQAANDPEYYALTSLVNKASIALAGVLSAHSIECAYTHKVTLVDEDMDVEYLSSVMHDKFDGRIVIECKSPTQLVCYAHENEALKVKDELYTINSCCGIISLFNMVDRIKRPYILGLHTWQDARYVRDVLQQSLYKQVS